MTKHEQLHGLYVITDQALSEHRRIPIPEMAAAAIDGGARILQYRNKQAAWPERLREASELAAYCRARKVVFLINDDVELAQTAGAEGVHLGQSDTQLSEARAQLGPHAIIGMTCHDSLALAQAAQSEGADYVAFGRFFPSQTKPTAPAAQIDVLYRARQTLTLPIVAIGGITPQNAANLLDAGADMLAVIHGVFGAPNIATAADEYVRLFTLQSRQPRKA